MSFGADAHLTHLTCLTHSCGVGAQVGARGFTRDEVGKPVAAGVYLVRVSTPEGIMTGRFVIVQ